MHANILHVLLVRSDIVLGCETAQPISEDEHSQWIDSCY